MRRSIPGLLVVIVAVSACAVPGGTGGPSPSQPTSPDPTEAISHPTAADEAILVMEWTGGFITPEMAATRLPQFVMLGDGRVIVPGVHTLEYPGPAVPPLMQRTLTDDGIQQVLERVEQTGYFDEDLELRGAMNVLADAANTDFHLRADGREVTVSVYALGSLGPDLRDPALEIPAEEQEAHEVLGSLQGDLSLPDEWLGEDAWATDEWEPYEADAFRLYVRDVTDQPPVDGDPPAETREWPTDHDPATVGEEQPAFGGGTRCFVVEGEDAAAWRTALDEANEITRWTDEGGDEYRVAARPLLPHEARTCPPVAGA